MKNAYPNPPFSAFTPPIVFRPNNTTNRWEKQSPPPNNSFHGKKKKKNLGNVLRAGAKHQQKNRNFFPNPRKAKKIYTTKAPPPGRARGVSWYDTWETFPPWGGGGSLYRSSFIYPAAGMNGKKKKKGYAFVANFLDLGSQLKSRVSHNHDDWQTTFIFDFFDSFQTARGEREGIR